MKMNNCRSCRWGPTPASCQRSICSYEPAKNIELLKRLTDEELAEWLANSPYVAKTDFWIEWLNKTDEELLRRVDFGK